eukprot:TRINITY_DN4139_c0_g2_i1.p1 TRINITY_DN4139_c0_g2~~TRINITY_DN4139_c0_g2_i1.p1  ORF type:complete len:460 (+),score=70.97 TRINITY_DN4139_c0_g2_i1:56-1381(+)
MEKVTLPDSLEKFVIPGDTENCQCALSIFSPESCSASDVQKFSPAAIKQRRHSDLNARLRLFLCGTEVDLPEDYRVGNGVILHEESGIEVCYPPIQIGKASDSDILVFHYAGFGSFQLIVSNKSCKHLLASKGHECAHYGDGVYGTVKAPHEFGSKYAVIVNNYTNSADRSKQRTDSDCWLKKGRADFCIPIKVSRSIVYNVMREKTPEIPQPGHRRDGKAIRSDRDIWVIRTSNSAGEAQDVGEDEDTLFQRFGFPNFSIRLDALDMLKEKAAEGSLRAKSAIFRGLQDVDPVVRVHAVEVISELAKAGLLDSVETRNKLDELMQNETDVRVRLFATEALSYLAVQVVDVAAVQAAEDTAAASAAGAARRTAEVAEVMQIFKTTDENGDGKISYQEMYEVLRVAGMDEDETWHLIEAAHTDNDNSISRDGFVSWLMSGMK